MSTDQLTVVRPCLDKYLLCFSSFCSRSRSSVIVTKVYPLSSSCSIVLGIALAEFRSTTSSVVCVRMRRFSEQQLMKLMKALSNNFFLIGENMLEWPDIGKRIYGEGHAIGNHSQLSHLAADKAYTSQIKSTQKIFKDIYGFQPTILRPAYGEITDDIHVFPCTWYFPQCSRLSSVWGYGVRELLRPSVSNSAVQK